MSSVMANAMDVLDLIDQDLNESIYEKFCRERKSVVVAESALLIDNPEVCIQQLHRDFLFLISVGYLRPTSLLVTERLAEYETNLFRIASEAFNNHSPNTEYAFFPYYEKCEEQILHLMLKEEICTRDHLLLLCKAFLDKASLGIILVKLTSVKKLRVKGVVDDNTKKFVMLEDKYGDQKITRSIYDYCLMKEKISRYEELLHDLSTTHEKLVEFEHKFQSLKFEEERQEMEKVKAVVSVSVESIQSRKEELCRIMERKRKAEEREEKTKRIHFSKD